MLKQAVSRGVALSLVPIVLGVSLASMTELSFTWVAFGAAMASNLAFASRNIYPGEELSYLRCDDEPKAGPNSKNCACGRQECSGYI